MLAQSNPVGNRRRAVLLNKDRQRQLLKALREMPLDQLWRQVLGYVGHRRRGVLRQLAHDDNRRLAFLLECTHPANQRRSSLLGSSVVPRLRTNLQRPYYLARVVVHTMTATI